MVKLLRAKFAYAPERSGMSDSTIALKDGAAAAPEVGPAKKVFAPAVAEPVPPFTIGSTFAT